MPEFIDPWRYADNQKAISGKHPLAQMHRLQDALIDIEGDAEFTLRFRRDEKRRVRIEGEVNASLPVVCQRCLGVLRLDVVCEPSLAVIEVYDEVDRIDEDCDPVLSENGRVRLLDIIEDELILALPQVAMHPAGECDMNYEGPGEVITEAASSDSASETEENPFAVLARLKSQQKH